MNNRWMATYAVVLGLLSTACFWGGLGGGYSGSDDDYSREHTDEPPDYSSDDGYHGGEAVRQALTAPAPQVDNAGYTEDAFAYGCEVHAQCGPDEVCASDPACPDYLYCYDKDEADCDCGDRFNTVCYFGDCVMRGFDCSSGCPAGTTCDGSVGACVCDSPGCLAPTPYAQPEPEPEEPEEPTIATPQSSGEKCFDDSDCPEQSCVNGTCGAVPCWAESDCMREESCELAGDGLRYCVSL